MIIIELKKILEDFSLKNLSVLKKNFLSKFQPFSKQYASNGSDRDSRTRPNPWDRNRETNFETYRSTRDSSNYDRSRDSVYDKSRDHIRHFSRDDTIDHDRVRPAPANGWDAPSNGVKLERVTDGDIANDSRNDRYGQRGVNRDNRYVKLENQERRLVWNTI